MIKTLALSLALVMAAAAATADDFANAGMFRQLQFSPDGKYVLAQDDSQITVLTVEPLRVVYHVQADKQVLGHFTPDSRELVLVTSMTQVVDGKVQGPNKGSPRVERWSIVDRVRVASTVIPSLRCGTASLAPDGHTLACDDLNGTLHVVDVQAGKEVWIKKKFAIPYVATPWAADFQFSPDGRFLVARPDGRGDTIIWDSSARNLVKSQGEIKLLSKSISRADDFAFVAPDSLVLLRARWLSWKKGSKCSAETVDFPSGTVISTVEIPHCPGGLSFETGRPQRPFRQAMDPNFFIINYEVVIARGYADGIDPESSPIIRLSGRKATVKTCAFESKTGRIIQGELSTLDVFGSRHVSELQAGEVGLWEMDKGLLECIKISKK